MHAVTTQKALELNGINAVHSTQESVVPAAHPMQPSAIATGAAVQEQTGSPARINQAKPLYAHITCIPWAELWMQYT